MKCALAVTTIAFWAFAFLAELWAQGPVPGSLRPPETGEFTLKVDVNMVLVEATVRDHKGRIADDLKREDFRVFEDGVEQKVIYFLRDELPLAVALVMDRSGSISPMIGELHRAAYDTLS